jgi:hypothetical protein
MISGHASETSIQLQTLLRSFGIAVFALAIEAGCSAIR